MDTLFPMSHSVDELALVHERCLNRGHQYVPEAVWRQATLAICKIVKLDKGKISYATGFLINWHGSELIMTNYHVLSSACQPGSKDCYVQFERESPSARVHMLKAYLDWERFYADKNLDCAVVAVQRGSTLKGIHGIPAHGHSAEISPHDPISLIGYPYGKRLMRTVSHVDALNGHLFSHSADTVTGSSGSPVFNKFGLLVGIHHSYSQRDEKNCGTHMEPIRVWLHRVFPPDVVVNAAKSNPWLSGFDSNDLDVLHCDILRALVLQIPHEAPENKHDCIRILQKHYASREKELIACSPAKSPSKPPKRDPHTCTFFVENESTLKSEPMKDEMVSTSEPTQSDSESYSESDSDTESTPKYRSIFKPLSPKITTLSPKTRVAEDQAGHSIILPESRLCAPVPSLPKCYRSLREEIVSKGQGKLLDDSTIKITQPVRVSSRLTAWRLLIGSNNGDDKWDEDGSQT